MRRRLLCLVVVLVAALAVVQPAASAGTHTPILGESRATAAAARDWARAHGAKNRFLSLAALYWGLAPPRGVRPEVAYAQAAKETAFGRFGGVIDASFKNPCGLKKMQGGGNYDAGAHQRFSTWRIGVAAHLDHLALYAGAPGYPRAYTPDPRHFPALEGKARSIEALGGAWAPARDYGLSVARLATAFSGPSSAPGSEPVEDEPAAAEVSEAFWRSLLPFVDLGIDTYASARP